MLIGASVKQWRRRRSAEDPPNERPFDESIDSSSTKSRGDLRSVQDRFRRLWRAIAVYDDSFSGIPFRGI